MRLIYAILLYVVHCCYADYIGAIVEYNALPGPTPNLTIEENLRNYIYQIEQAAGFGAQIIVFPEYGLTGMTDNPEGFGVVIPNVGASEFSNESFPLLSLSNAAITHRIHIVVNLLELVNGTDNSSIYYNTNLVFASNGTLIARYRKINLYEEPNLTPGNETVTFTTDFGTFGLITCADIVFYNPAQTVLINTGVTDVIFPTAWTSYIPFYMSLGVQVGYALANRVNLLSANLNDPANGIGGSSIVSADGTVLRRILTDSPASNAAFANIRPPASAENSFQYAGFDFPSNETRAQYSNYKNITDFQYDSYVYKLLDLAPENITDEICDGDFCCNFNIVVFQNETNSSEVYRLAAYSGKAKFGTDQILVKFCALVGCLNQDIASCGVRPPTAFRTTFRQMTVWGNWEAQPEIFYRPVSLRGNLEPVYNTTYLENRTNETVGVSFNVTRSNDNVVLFGLYVRGGVDRLGVSLGLVTVLVLIQSFL